MGPSPVAEEARRRVMAAAVTLPDTDRAIDLAHTVSYADASSTTFSDLVTGKRIGDKCAGDSSWLQEWRMLFFGVLNDSGYQPGRALCQRCRGNGAGAHGQRIRLAPLPGQAPAG